MTDRLLVLAVDIDNDLYRKTKITGPVTGRANNLEAAKQLALADPQDTDANTMFEAVRKYDELKDKGHTVFVATITGAEKEGYAADSEISRQLDKLLDKFKADACVLVTDGASDTRVLPILKTRIKVNSVDIVRMKQAEQFENTYFAILEKLKEPHYARIVFGIPAVILLLFTVSYYFNYGWQLPIGLIGLYLIIKGFGVEESFVNSFRGFGFSIDRLSFIFYISAILFFALGLIIGIGSYNQTLLTMPNQLEALATGIESFLILFPVSLVLYLVGRIMDLEQRRLKYRAIKQGTYIGYTIIAVSLLYLTAAWIAGQLYFGQFLLYAIIALGLGYVVSKLSSTLRIRAVKKSKIKNKHVINDIGAYIGKVVDVDSRSGIMFVKTDYGSVIRYEIDRITNIADRVIIR
jgi:putative membrane protein